MNSKPKKEMDAFFVSESRNFRGDDWQNWRAVRYHPNENRESAFGTF